MSNIILPDILEYPKILAYADCPELKNTFCYVFKEYTLSGIAIQIVRDGEYAVTSIADWQGNIIDPNIQKNDQLNEILGNYLAKITLTMKYTRVPKAIFYFSITDKHPCLVDMRLSINKFSSPGYLIDFFGKQNIPLQEQIGKPVMLDEEQIKLITDKQGDYVSGKFIIKPNAFKSIIRGDEILPAYGVIR
jgi:hypothetical protein